MEKTTVFNLIILDESGSMSHLTQETVSGCNETLNVVRSLQEKNADSQRYLTSIYLFQSGNNEFPSRYICKNKPINDVKDLTTDDYHAYGCTPLLDAVGSTLVDLEAVASTHEDSTATVTIITDGMENASTEYSLHQVASLISRLKELGWTFNFIGANIDVDAISKQMNIDNAMAFKADKKGTRQMWNSFGASAMAHDDERVKSEACLHSMEEKIAMRKKMSKKFFKNDIDPDQLF